MIRRLWILLVWFWKWFRSRIAVLRVGNGVSDYPRGLVLTRVFFRRAAWLAALLVLILSSVQWVPPSYGQAVRLPSQLKDIQGLEAVTHGFSQMAQALGYTVPDTTYTETGTVSTTKSNSSTFSGWNCPVGVFQNFNGCQFQLYAFDNTSLPTMCHVTIVTEAGSTLAETTVPVAPLLNTAYTVTVNFGANIANGSGAGLRLQYRCNGRVAFRGVNVSPPGGQAVAQYVTSADINTAFGTNSTITTDTVWFRATHTNVSTIQQLTTSAKNTVSNASSTFTGWGYSIGQPSAFNRVSIPLYPFSASNVPTLMRVRLRSVNNSGAILTIGGKSADYTVTLPTLTINKCQWIDVDLPATYTPSAKVWLEYFTNGYTGWWQVNTDPDGASAQPQYSTANNAASSITNFSTSNTSDHRPGWVQTSLVDHSQYRVTSYQDFASLFKTQVLNLSTPTLSLPSQLYAVEGRTLEIFNENIVRQGLIRPDRLEYNYDLTATGTNTQKENRFTFVPVAGDAGTKTLTFQVKMGGNTLATATSTINVVALTAGSGVTRKVILIGDSTTSGGQVGAELINLFGFNKTSPTGGGGADVMSISLQGTQTVSFNDAGGTSRSVKHEGYSGQTFNWFATNASSPFVFSSVFNFGTYLTNNAITMASSDWVIFHLGINDVFGATTDASVLGTCASMVSDLSTMITSIQSAVSGIRIGICITIPPSQTNNGFGANYGSGQSRDRYNRNRFLWAEYLQTWFSTAGLSNCFLIPHNVALDTANNMQTTSVALNLYNATTQTEVSNGVHPASSGYYQLSNVLYMFLKNKQ